MEQTGNVCFKADFFLFDGYTLFCVKEAEEEYKASDYTEDHHNDTESKCLVAVSEFVYQCQGKSADYSGTDGEKKVLQDARTVLSCGSSLSAGRMDAIGIFTTVYAVESRM